MAVDLAKITASAERITSVKGSVLAFVAGVPQLIRDAIAADDMADATNINALADKLEVDASEIMTAITAGTPAESEPEPTPTEGETGGTTESETGGGTR
jgi:hypothetical protein